MCKYFSEKGITGKGKGPGKNSNTAKRWTI